MGVGGGAGGWAFWALLAGAALRLGSFLEDEGLLPWWKGVSASSLGNAGHVGPQVLSGRSKLHLHAAVMREPSGRAGSVAVVVGAETTAAPRTRSWLGRPGSQGASAIARCSRSGVVGLGPALATTFKGNVGKTIHVAAVCSVDTYLAAEVSSSGGEVAPREVGFPRQWYPGLGGRHVAWDDSSLGGCRGSLVSLPGLWLSAAQCLFRSSSRVLWRHAGHLLDRFSLFSGALHVVWRAESMEAMRSDVPVRRRSAISPNEAVVVVGGSRWLGRSEPPRTHGVCVTVALFF